MQLPRISIPKKPKLISVQLPDGISFSELFGELEIQNEHCFLLESAGENAYDSRYSVLGFDPELRIQGRKGFLSINGQDFACANPYFELRKLYDFQSLGIGYTGGLVGILSYDAMNFFEDSLQVASHPDFPAMEFGLYLDGLIYDKFTGETQYFYHNRNRMAVLIDLFQQIRTKGLSSRECNLQFRGVTESKESHAAKVELALEEVRAGNTFQCQIGFAEEYQVQGNAFLIYKALQEINPSPHMFFLKNESRILLGASPELLFRLRQGEMESFPLAGTTKRGKDETEDRTLARELLSNPKEIAEHNMLIDLHRNDIGKVAKFGTVKVRRRFDIKKFSHVQHISSEVVGILRTSEDMFTGLASSFPAGTLSGAPKIESMKIIDRLENSPRGPYGGAVGLFGLNGDCTFAIPIRSFFISGEKGYVRASGGIVYDSTPEKEFEEIQNKMASVKKALQRFL